MTAPSGLLEILVAALGGAAIGVERQRSGHASGPRARFGGIRTFTLVGGVAGVSGWLSTLNLTGMAIVLTAGAVALVVSGYVAASRKDVDATTEVAALVAIGAGIAAGTGHLALLAGAVLGLTDVDALTISMTTTAASVNGPAVAAEAIAIGILANCLMKLVLAVALGAPRFARRTATTLAVMATAIGLSIGFLR